MAAILVAIVTVPEHMPQEPADHPVLFFQALGVSTHVIEIFRLWSGMPIDVQDLPMHGSLADLRITERGLGVLHDIVPEDIWRCHDSSASSAGLFLETLSEYRSVVAKDISHDNADLHHVVQVLVVRITLIQTQPFHELRL